MTIAPPLWQPTLTGALLHLRPLAEGDFEGLYAAASDPLIWEQHPERERYKREKFEPFLRSAIACGGALTILSVKTGQIVGSSRFTNHSPEQSSVEIGYTFLTRSCWGQGHNRELKELMLGHAFGLVDTAIFFVGESNLRSQSAMRKLGAVEIARVTRTQLDGRQNISVSFRIQKADWLARRRVSS